MAYQTEDNSESSRARCRQFDADLPAFFEGESLPGVVSHAKECPFCAVILADLELIRNESRALPLEESPATVWANVRATLAAEGMIQEPTGGWLRWVPVPVLARFAAPVGALACLAIVSAVLLVPPASLDQSGSSGWLSVTDRDAMAARVYSLEDSALAGMVSELEKSFESRQASLAPAVKAAYRKGLESLDASIRESRASVEREPANTLAREYLVSAYTQKAEVLAAALKFDVP